MDRAVEVEAELVAEAVAVVHRRLIAGRSVQVARSQTWAAAAGLAGEDLAAVVPAEEVVRWEVEDLAWTAAVGRAGGRVLVEAWAVVEEREAACHVLPLWAAAQGVRPHKTLGNQFVFAPALQARQHREHPRQRLHRAAFLAQWVPPSPLQENSPTWA